MFRQNSYLLRQLYIIVIIEEIAPTVRQVKFCCWWDCRYSGAISINSGMNFYLTEVVSSFETINVTVLVSNFISSRIDKEANEISLKDVQRVQTFYRPLAGVYVAARMKW